MFINKEIPDELKSIEIVRDVNDYVKIVKVDTNNKFLLAEKDGVPLYIDIPKGKLMSANNNRIFFFDLYDSNMLNSATDIDFNTLNKNSNFNFQINSQNFFFYFYNKIKKKISEQIKNKFSSIFNSNCDTMSSPSLTLEKSDEEFNKKATKCITINSFGSILALVNRNNYIILVNLENQEAKIYKTKLNDEIVDLKWHTLKKEILLIVFKNKLEICNISKDLRLVLEKQIDLNEILKVKYFRNGEYLIILHDNRLLILDSQFSEIYSKSLSFYFQKDTDILISPNGNYFIINTDSSIFLFNFFNMSFKCWTDFQGKITSIVISENSKYILVFTSHCAIYVLYNTIQENIISDDNTISYSNIQQYYLHSFFKLNFNIFSFSCSPCRIKARLNYLNNRLVVLFSRESNQYNELKVFEIDFKKSVHDIKLNLLFTMNNFQQMSITDFELYYNYLSKQDSLLTLWDDSYFSLTYLNS